MGLGTPQTVGMLGPVWRGEDSASSRQAFPLGGVESIKISNATAYVINKKEGLNLRLTDTFLNVYNKGETIEIDSTTRVTRDDIVSPISVRVQFSPDYLDFSLNFEASDLNLNMISPDAGRFAALKALDAPMDIKTRIVSRRETGLEAIDLDVLSGSGRLEIGPIAQNFDQAKITAQYDKSAQALKFSKVKLKADRVIVDGAASFADVGTPADGLFVKPADFVFDLNTLDIDATPFFPKAFNLNKAVVAGVWERNKRHLSLSKIALDFGDFQTNLVGETKRNTDAKGKWSMIKLNGEINGSMSSQQLLELWPSEFALGARDYIERAIRSAQLSKFKVALNIPEDVLKTGKMGNENLTLDFRVDDAFVQYIGTMTPLTMASGQGRLQGNRFEIIADTGRVGGVIIDSGRVDIPRLWPKGGDLKIDVKGHGPVRDLLTLIDQKPFGYLKNYDVTPEEFSGRGHIDLSITRPLLEFFDQNRIKYAVTGQFTDVSAPFSLGLHQIQNGNVDLKVDGKGLRVTGPISLGPWQADLVWSEIFDLGATPSRYEITGIMNRDDLDAFGLGFRQYFDGEINVTVDAAAKGLEILSASIIADLTQSDLQVAPYWYKPKGQSGTMTANLSRSISGAMSLKDIDLSASGLSVTGQVDLADNWRLINLDLDNAKIDNFIDAGIRAKPDPSDEKFDVYITGDFLDISPLVTGSLQTQSNTMDVPILLTASLSKLQLSQDYNLRDANILFAHDGVGIRQMRLKGQTVDGDFLAEMVANDASATREVRVDIPNASEAAYAFLKMDNIAGGRLEIDAKLPPTGVEGALRGAAQIEDFTLVRAPILAQMLSLASLRGLGDMLGGTGLKFETFEVPFSLEDGVLSVRDAKATGPALGVTGEGDLMMESKLLDFDGVIVPAYTANAILGSVPVIGDIFVGKEGEGIFALSYTVKGSFDQTQIAVNPLSALTPGFLRNIFKPNRDELPEDLKETIIEVAPEPDGSEPKEPKPDE